MVSKVITPPTDSLYKFIAIAGVVMVIWGSAFSWDKEYEYRLMLADYAADTEKASQQATYLKQKYDLLVKQREAVNRHASGYKDVISAIDQKKAEIYVQLIEARFPITKDKQRIEIMSEAMRVYRITGWLAIIAGLFMLLAGFWMWYHRLQKHVDQNWMNQVDEN